MKIKLGDYIISPIIEEDEMFFSKHTSAPLRRLRITFCVNGKDANDDLQSLLADKAEAVTLDDNDQPGESWKIRQLSYNYQTGRSDYDYSCELERTENLQIEKLILSDFEVEPYFYKEDFSDDVLIIRARVKLSPEEFKRLKDLLYGEIYFPVVRKGINEKPREMRFGKNIWSESDEEIKFEIYLIDRSHDIGNKGLGLFEPEMTNIQVTLTKTTESFLKLLTLLESKGLITSGERESMKDVDKEQYLSRLTRFYEVNDLDELPFDN
jgi:hypothetical protein